MSVSGFIIAFAALSALLYLSWVVVGLLSDCDPEPLWLKRLRGVPFVHIRENGVTWSSPVTVNAWGEWTAYRYPHTKVGIVKLNKDGTGMHIWPAEWIGEDGSLLSRIGGETK